MPSRFTPRTLAQWPWVVVRIDCPLCRRRGCYRLTRLAAKYGPEQSIDGLLRDLAHDCPWYNEGPRKYGPRCGARFVDLNRDQLPTDDPEEPIYRQRQPTREDLPTLRASNQTPDKGRSLPRSLSEWPASEVGYECRRCAKHGSFGVAVMLASHGDVPTIELLRAMTKSCPRRGTTAVYELCGATFVWPYPER